MDGDPPSLSSFCIVEMEYKNKGFEVYISCRNCIDDFYEEEIEATGDTYQNDEIIEALEWYFDDLGVGVEKIS